MLVSSIMRSEVATVDMDASLMLISRMFRERGFHHVLVVDNGELCGVISERDLLRAASPFVDTPSEQNRDRATLRKRAHQLMTRRPITVTTETQSEHASQLMLQENISCLPVLSPDGRLVGIVTWKDLLRAYTQRACSAQ